MGKKIVVSLIAGLIVIVLVELVYLYFISGTLRQTEKKKEAKPIVSCQDCIPESLKPYLEDIAAVQGERALNKNALLYIANIRKGKLSSSILTNEYEGVLLDVQGEGIAPNQFPYQLLVKLENDAGAFELIYGERNVEQMEIYSLKNNIRVNLARQDLEIGKRIIIRETRDLTKTCRLDECLFKLEIEVI